MSTFRKRVLPTIKIFAIIVICISVSLPVNAAVRFMSYSYSSRWRYAVENFSEHQEDFMTVAEFCIKACSDDPEGSGNYLVYDRDESQLKCKNNKDAVASDEVAQCFLRVQGAFAEKGATLDVVSYRNGSVWFETDNGVYSVVYSPCGAPKAANSASKVISKRITENWYHVTRKV